MFLCLCTTVAIITTSPLRCQCGFKMFTRAAARRIFPNQRLNRSASCIPSLPPAQILTLPPSFIPPPPHPFTVNPLLPLSLPRSSLPSLELPSPSPVPQPCCTSLNHSIIHSHPIPRSMSCFPLLQWNSLLQPLFMWCTIFLIPIFCLCIPSVHWLQVVL